MFYDSIQLLDGSSLVNVVVDSGAAFPANPNAGELFFKTTDNLLYVHNGTEWTSVGSGASGGGTFTVAGDVTGTLENGAGTLTLETVNSNVGNYGTASSVPTFTINAKGLITAATQSSISITPSQIASTVPVAKGGTGQTTASAAINALVPIQATSAGRFLMTDGSAVSWQVPAGGTVSSVDMSGGSTGLTLSGGPITTSGTLTLGGVLGVAAGGTGQSTTAGALAALLPNQAIHSGKFLQTNGSATSWATISSANVTAALGYTPVNKAGDTMSGLLVLSGNPTLDMHAATKQYVDSVAAGINVLGACRTATTAPLTATYSNGASGVGATLTGDTVLPSIGGISLSGGQRVLVKNQVDQKENGIYVVVSSAANPWVLTRAADYDGRFAGTIDAGDTVFVQEGDLAGTLWVQNTTGQLTIGTSNLSWTQFSGPGSYSAGTGIGLSNNVISNAGVLSLTGGSNIGVTAATGNITVSFDGTLPVASGGTGKTSVQEAMNAFAGGVTTNRVLTGNGTNIVLGTLNLSTDCFTGTLPVARGGTGVTSTSEIATAILPSQTANSGKFLMTTDAGLQWVGISVEGGGGSLQFNNGGQFDGTAQISYNGTDTLTVGADGGTFNINGAIDAEGLTILAGITQGGGGGQVPPKSSTLTLQGGRGDTKTSQSGVSPGKAGGDVVIAGGISESHYGGSVIIKTASTNSLTERLKIDSSGTWYVSGAPGAAGYVLTSGGAGVAPTWTIPPAVTSINIDGGTTGLTASGGPITTSGTLTLGGTLAIANGGTGQTTAQAAVNALLPSQSGNNGRFLTTDGTNTSWVAAQGTGSVTSVNASGGTTGLTFSGGPIDAAGTLTLAGTLSIANGGTGQITAQAALNALAGSVTSNRVLAGNGTNIILTTLSLSSDCFTGTLPVARGGTGQSTATGAINAIVPSQSGKIGQYLTTNGTEVSWSTISSVAAAGEQGDIQFNDSGITAANPALKLIGDNLVATKDMLVNGMTVGTGPGIGPTVGGVSTSNKNTAFGYGVLGGSSTAVRNTGMGYSALSNIVNGDNNVAVGYSAASSIAYVSGNVAVGSEALSTNVQGGGNVAIGYRAAKGTSPYGGPSSISNNVAVGYEALTLISTGSTNVAVGSSALNKTTTGDGNIAVGSSALINNTTANNNVAIGKNSLYSSYGATNTAIGYESLFSNTAGGNNVAIGSGAGGDLTNGDDNTIIGCHRGEAGLARTTIISAGTLQRLRFNSDGALELTEDSGYGTSGQVLMSNGSAAAPSWSTPTAGTVTSVSGSGGSTGLTLSGGPITASGTLTLGGTLAIANGGTGQTTANDAFNALAPSQTGNSGKFLTSDGSSTSWSSISQVPSQTGNSGKFLTTDGNTASWAASSSFTGGTVANATTFSSTVSFGANYDESVISISSTSSTTINCALGNNFEITLANSITSLAFSGIPSSGRLYFCSLILIQDGTGNKTVTWPGSIRWQGGTAPTVTATANKIDLITLVTYNAGTTWLGTVGGQNF